MALAIVLLPIVALGCTDRPPLSGQLPRDTGRLGEGLFPEERQRVEVFLEACPSIVHVDTIEFRRDPVHFNVLKIPRGMGSGFVWDLNGHIVTNAHVIRGAEEARVLLKDGSSWVARVMGTDPSRDVAVLMIDAPKESLTPISEESGGNIRVGQTVLAVGNPFGFDHSLTVGVISALGREIHTDSGPVIRGVIQTDAAINPGSSGGPLLDSAGRFVGINTALAGPSGAFAGIGFAVPADDVRKAVSRILGQVPAQRVALGIRAAEDPWAHELGLTGVLVLEVMAGGPAEQAGLRPSRTSVSGDLELGDLIIALEGEPISSRGDLDKALKGRQAGDRVSITVLRPDRQMDFVVVLALEEH